jgi:hypothetical protein
MIKKPRNKEKNDDDDTKLNEWLVSQTKIWNELVSSWNFDDK